MRENRPYGSEGGEQRYCSPTPIGFARSGAPLLCLDPGLAPGRRRMLSVARSKATRFHPRRSGGGRSPGFARMARWSCVWSPASAGTTKNVERRHIQGNTITSSSLRRRPESRLRTHGAPLCLDPGLRRDDEILSLARFSSRPPNLPEESFLLT